MTQSELLLRLLAFDQSWTRAAVGMLESKGVRGERMTDVAVLCAALGVPLNDLLVGTGDVQLRDGAPRSPDWVIDALAGNLSYELIPHAPGSGQTRRALNVGVDDKDEARRIAKSLAIPLETLCDFVESRTAQRSPTVFRDFLGGLEPSDAREDAKIKRAQGTRRLRQMIVAAGSPDQDSAKWSAIHDFESWLSRSRQARDPLPGLRAPQES
jgi:hypothetical protein